MASRSWLILALSVGACRDSAPSPSFEPLFPGIPGPLMSLSSPNMADLDGDGALDIVYGSGVDRLQQPRHAEWTFATEPDVPGYVTAVSGAANEILWRVPHTGGAYTTPRFAELNGDGVADIVMGGREGALAAFNGRDGAALWQVVPADIAETAAPYNFSTPATIGDADDDGVIDFVTAYGGDATRPSDAPRAPGFLAIVSGADGTILAAHETPDRAETYASPVVYARVDGARWLVFGTGGESEGGAAFRAPVASLLDGSFLEHVERLTSTGVKGVMAPATLVELTGDDELDIVVSTFDGRLIVIDGASGEPLWEQHGENEESYHPAAVARIARDGKVGLLVSRGIGVFPNYAGRVHRLFDARDGSLLYVHRSRFFPAGAPLAVDLTDDGVDELFFFSDPGRIHIYHGPSKELLSHDVDANLSATPLIAAPRGAGSLELIGVAWWNLSPRPGVANWRDLRSQLLRLDLGADAPEFKAWAGYMGTETNGRYRPPDAGDRS